MELRSLASEVGARLIVDTSVQPMQRLHKLGLADLVVFSLSKYPTQGQTIGGAILGAAAELEAEQPLQIGYEED